MWKNAVEPCMLDT